MQFDNISKYLNLLENYKNYTHFSIWKSKWKQHHSIFYRSTFYRSVFYCSIFYCSTSFYRNALSLQGHIYLYKLDAFKQNILISLKTLWFNQHSHSINYTTESRVVALNEVHIDNNRSCNLYYQHSGFICFLY